MSKENKATDWSYRKCLNGRPKEQSQPVCGTCGSADLRYYDDMANIIWMVKIMTKEELKDLGVGCIFTIACIDANTLDW